MQDCRRTGVQIHVLFISYIHKFLMMNWPMLGWIVWDRARSFRVQSSAIDVQPYLITIMIFFVAAKKFMQCKCKAIDKYMNLCQACFTVHGRFEKLKIQINGQ